MGLHSASAFLAFTDVSSELVDFFLSSATTYAVAKRFLSEIES